MSSFFTFGAHDRLKHNKLVKLSLLIDWDAIGKHLAGIHKSDLAPQNGGNVPYDRLKMLKTILLKEWHSLSDPETEDALRVRMDFMLFTGFELTEDTPDASTICRFRNALIAKGLDKKVFEAVGRELERLNLKVEHSAGAVLDATIVESTARPRRTIVVEEDRKESGSPVEVHESKDPDARWLKKGKKCYFGYKGFAVTDTDGGFIQGVSVEPANHAEVSKLGEMLECMSAERLYADKAYDSRELLRGRCKSGIMHRAARNRPLSERQKLANKLISKSRYIVEQCFGTMKRVFGFERASYRGREKVEGQMRLKAVCFNLLKGLNMVELAGA